MITLRHFEHKDKTRLIASLNDPRVSQFLSPKIPFPYTEQDAEWWIDLGSKAGLIRAITLDDQLIGCIGVTKGEFEYARNGELGYWLNSDFWGKGYASDAVNLIIEEVFKTTDINRLFATVFCGNLGSMRVLEKCHFVKEATLSQGIYKNGQFYDSHLFARLKK